METATIELTVPKEMLRFLRDEDSALRNAMLIYPAVRSGAIACGKAAEIIGMPKLELMDLYDGISMPYIHLSHEEILSEIDAFEAWRDRTER